ncbi:hypothetical protein FPOAC2_00487 [Fusarium poae]|uniref:Uncharacterized protein n=1 Tax=Fusarium poae TaxID=36050 RepID=A0A1B8B166_FUSPO|nr:hypothetical protein FPOA_00417 [Fusarium poae]
MKTRSQKLESDPTPRAKVESSNLNAQVKSLRKQLKSEESQHKDLKIDYEKLAEKYYIQKAELQDVYKKLRNSSQEEIRLRLLLNGGGFGNETLLVDAEFKRIWKSLTCEIMDLALKLNGTWSRQSLDDKVTERLRRVSKDYQKHYQDPDFCISIMQGYLWVLIQDIVFDTKQKIWGGPGVTTLKDTRERLIAHIGEIEGKSETEPSVPQIAGWLSRGYPIMGKLYGNDSIDVERVVDFETKRLRPFMADHQSKTDRTDDMVSKDLKRIIDFAIELDQGMVGSRAVYEVYWGDRSQEPGSLGRWNPEAMEVDAWNHTISSKSLVLFRISPALYKFGSNDGRGYDSYLVIGKGLVVCD